MQSVTVPLFYKQNDSAYSVATGTLFEIANRHFIVTARHIFDDFAPECIAYPERLNKIVRRTLGISRLVKPDTEKIDVAVIEVHEETTREKLISGWQFLTLDNVAPATSNGTFALMGYPSQLAERIPPAGIVYGSDRILVPPPTARNVNPEIDLFFEHGKTVFKEGREVNPPDLRGTSGASVWEFGNSEGGLWAPTKFLKVVGVQSAQTKGSYFRAVSWGAVASIFGQMDGQLGAAIQRVLEVT
jgi:hypothetical protein